MGPKDEANVETRKAVPENLQSYVNGTATNKTAIKLTKNTPCSFSHY